MPTILDPSKLAKAEPRLAGMLVTQANVHGEPPARTLFPWPQVHRSSNSYGESQWRLHVDDTDSEQDSPHRVILTGREHRLAARAHRRGLLNQWKCGALRFRETFNHRPLLGWTVTTILLAGLVALASQSSPLFASDWRQAPGTPYSERYVVLHYFVVGSAVGIYALMMAVVVYVAWRELSGAVASVVNVTSECIQVDCRNGRTIAADWSDLKHVRRQRICFSSGVTIKLPMCESRSADVAYMVEAALHPDNVIANRQANRVQPWRMLATGLALMIGMMAFLAYLSPIIPWFERTVVPWLFVSIMCVLPAVALLSAPLINRTTKAMRRRKRIRERVDAKRSPRS